ncbi:MAG: tRNA-2-methylthio-N6-dimethylallyladenosine synthase, partial [Chloroflexota bacterium]|nr:tRNA-2-methylthio-N6-dimethylallyladenosine synthase [Chloroflexota bacterium]
TVRYDQVFAAAYSERPGTPATRLADDVPAEVKRARLNELLALQEGIGFARNEAWQGREVEVLVDRVTPPRSHAHEDDEPAATGRGAGAPAFDGRGGSPERASRVAGRSRQNKLVHLAGGPELVGRLVTARIDHAGPYALRGTLVPA